MAVPEALTQNVQYWTLVLRTLDTLIPSATVRAHQTLELDDHLFDQSDVVDTSWFQLDPAHYDLFLDDTVGTVHLANLSGSVDYASEHTPLVTWYGHDPNRYRILLNSSEGSRPSPLPEERLLWFTWDTRLWTLYAHDGKALVPVFSTAEIAAALELDPTLPIWMGWNGLRVDLFTVDPRQLPHDLCAAFVAHDLTVGTVHRSSS